MNPGANRRGKLFNRRPPEFPEPPLIFDQAAFCMFLTILQNLLDVGPDVLGQPLEVGLADAPVLVGSLIASVHLESISVKNF